MPFDKRLEYRNSPGTFVYDEASKTLYPNGSIQFAGMLYIDHIKDATQEAERLLRAVGAEILGPSGLPLPDDARTHTKVQELRELSAWSEAQV